jgi:hypothetical protein
MLHHSHIQRLFSTHDEIVLVPRRELETKLLQIAIQVQDYFVLQEPLKTEAATSILANIPKSLMPQQRFNQVRQEHGEKRRR